MQADSGNKILNLYHRLPVQEIKTLSFNAFRVAYDGYLNLCKAGIIAPGSLLTICDFTMSSNERRLWVIDPGQATVLFNSLVAHGMGSGEEFATTFSNQPESHQSSLGFYKTGSVYLGSHGNSLRLEGLDTSFNDKAYDRGIVVHGASYVSESFAKQHQRICRSHGCPALPVELAQPIIEAIQGGSCLFIYQDDRHYLENAAWLSESCVQATSYANKQ